MPAPFELSSTFIDELVTLRPVTATYLGIPGHDDRWGDLGVEGAEAAATLFRRYRDAFAVHLDHPEAAERLAARVNSAYLSERLDQFEHGDHLRDLAHMACTFEDFRQMFEVMDTSSAPAWEAICSRLETLEEALAAYRRRLEEGRSKGLVAARRQVLAVGEQAEELSGAGSPYLRLAEQAVATGHGEVGDRLGRAIERAREAVGGFAAYLTSTYLPSADPADAVGAERYLRASESFLGLVIDPAETYSWGWEEITRLRERMVQVAADIAPGSIREVAALLESDPAHAAPSPEAFVAFVEERQQRALGELDGSHFDVPAPGRRVTVNLAPSTTSLGAWYHAPSEDFSRPGSIWYALGRRTVIPLYQEVSTAYHEGFPGHHLQVVTAMVEADRLSRAQRLLIWYPGHGEGWALYTERLMDELGYFERPEYLFGMLASQLFRACRVVVDIGLHLGYSIPADGRFHPGESWTFETAVEFMQEVALQPPDYAASEVKRYLGWPGQAISYKVGEREILDLREEVRRREGSGFDLKRFHRRLLENGDIRLDLLRELVLA